MIRTVLVLVILSILTPVQAQLSGKEIIHEVLTEREKIRKVFADIDESPLPVFRADEFTNLPYYQDDDYKSV